MPIRDIAAESVQRRQNSQKTIWDAVSDLRSRGSSSYATREGVRVFSLCQPAQTGTSPSSNQQVVQRVSQTQQTASVADWAPVVTWSPPTALDPEAFRIDAAFDATILEVGHDSFIARLANKLDKNDVQEEAEFAFSEIPKADRALIAPGAMFYWFIGKTEKPHGQQSNSSLIRFRRLPAWSASDLMGAHMRASLLRAVLPLDAINEET